MQGVTFSPHLEEGKVCLRDFSGYKGFNRKKAL
jgi:hypothetical protein